jgi:type IV secretion system protein TrbC
MPKSPCSTLLLTLALAAVVIVALEPGLAHASTSDGMPWSTPLQNIGGALTGPVAYWLSLIGIFVCGAALVFGGEINELVRRLIMVVLMGSIMMGASSIVQSILVNTTVIL